MKITVQLRRGQSSESALRAILLEQLEALESTVDGVVADLDIELLHDFRVAARRTRSALTQVKGVLHKPAIRPFLAEFKWLGELTGPCRDLDVFLEDLEIIGASVTLPPALEPLLRAIRADAHSQVVEAIGLPRFQSLLERWRDYLEQAEDPSGPPAKKNRVPVEELAGRRILKAYGRVLRRGGGMSSQPAAAEMHRTRIDAKKLRYLLEFFKSLYPHDRIAPLVRELKDFQDILGSFQDAEAQRLRVRDFRFAMTSRDLAALEGFLVDRQDTYRSDFQGRFQVFASAASQAEYASLFGYNRCNGDEQ